jgi:regulator of nonsense transcripts 1
VLPSLALGASKATVPELIVLADVAASAEHSSRMIEPPESQSDTPATARSAGDVRTPLAQQISLLDSSDSPEGEAPSSPPCRLASVDAPAKPTPQNNPLSVEPVHSAYTAEDQLLPALTWKARVSEASASELAAAAVTLTDPIARTEVPPAEDAVSLAASSAECSLCGLDYNLVCHVDASRWICNNRPSGERSCAVMYASRHPGCVFRLHDSSRWGALEVVCRLTGSGDLRELGAVCDGLTLSIVCRSETQDKRFEPAIAGGILSPWLCDSSTTVAATALVARARAQRRQHRQGILPPPLHHPEGGSYVRHFTSLIAAAAKYDNAAGRDRAKADVSVVWKEGLQGPVACFTHNTGARTDFQVNERLLLERRVVDTAPWLATAVVVTTEGSVVVSAVLECTGGLRALDMSITTGFTITPQQPAISYDRMQTGVYAFAADEVAGCSPWVYNTVLGQRVAPMAVWVKTPPECGGSIPPASAAQQAAVLGSLTNPVFRVVGPPGTGKTTTLLRIVHALAHQERGQVLVCAPSNVAVDRAAIGLQRLGLSVLRVVASSRDASLGTELPAEVLLEAHIVDSARLTGYRSLKQQVGQLTAQDERQYNKQLREATIRALRSVAVLVCTCSTAGSTLLSALRFDSVVVDEAAQAVEPEVIIPLRMGPRRVVLVGDTNQLGPVVKCDRAKLGGLGVSLFERLQSLDTPSAFLEVQHRMHPSISAFPSAEFYGGRLLDGPAVSAGRPDVPFPWPVPHQPTFFYHVDGAEHRTDQGSYSNGAEAAVVVACVERLLKEGAFPEEVGVVAMYDAQRCAIESALHNPNVKVRNVDAFQGQERPFIVLSLTRSNQEKRLGFIADSNRINVALTRAQHGLIVVGDAKTISKAPMWRRFLQHYSASGAVVHGRTLEKVQKLDVDFSASANSAVTLAAFEESSGNQQQCRLTASVALIRAEPPHVLPSKVRTSLRRKALRYSRFEGEMNKDDKRAVAVDVFGHSSIGTTHRQRYRQMS